MFIVYQHLQIICQLLLHEGEIKPSSASSHSCPEFKERTKLLGLNSMTKDETMRQVSPRDTHIHSAEDIPRTAALALPGKAISSLHTSGSCLNFVIMGTWVFFIFSILTKDENVLSHKNMIPGTNTII